MNTLKRNCPSCNKELIYRNLRAYNSANKNNKFCCTCAVYGNPKNRKIYSLKRNCPNCEKELIYSSAIGCYNANKYNRVCGSCRSSLQMKNPITRNKRIESLKKIKHTKKWHNKITKNRKLNGTYNVSDETREKLKIVNIERKIQDGVLIWPNYNRNACKIFDTLESDLHLDGFYATKNKERRIGRFWVDYYEPNKNIIIEFDEKYHYDDSGKLRASDIKRQEWIINKTGCKFYRINENTNYEQFKYIISSNL